MESVLCPVNFTVVTFGTSAFRMLVLKVCLKSWNVKSVIPLRFSLESIVQREGTGR